MHGGVRTVVQNSGFHRGPEKGGVHGCVHNDVLIAREHPHDRKPEDVQARLTQGFVLKEICALFTRIAQPLEEAVLRPMPDASAHAIVRLDFEAELICHSKFPDADFRGAHGFRVPVSCEVGNRAIGKDYVHFFHHRRQRVPTGAEVGAMRTRRHCTGDALFDPIRHPLEHVAVLREILHERVRPDSSLHVDNALFPVNAQDPVEAQHVDRGTFGAICACERRPAVEQACCPNILV
mmetsp:Transcript_65186/g.212351  ORF Transcript_65186/g.212351 Transcript_65186/m.212351 type:complete len:236 (+) Transcript_65186:849-1556(+)